MFKALFKTRLQALFSYIFRGSRLGKKRGKAIAALFALLMVYAIGCFYMMFAMMFNSLCNPLVSAGLDWLYFAIAGIVAFAICFVGSIFTTQTQLYEAKDNEMLLAMPIPPGYILASRMAMLLVLNYFFEFMVAVPAGVVYLIKQPATAAGIVFFIICFLFLPFLVMTCSCLAGWIVALVSSKLRSKNLITMIFSLAFLAGYFYFYSQANNYFNALIQNGAAVADAMKRALFPAYHFGYAIAGPSSVSLALFILCAVLPFCAVYAVLSKSFITIATAKKGAAKIKYREKSLKVSGVMSALVKKELKHFVSSPMYMLNGALGVVFTVILPFVFIFKRDLIGQVFAAAPFIEQYTGAFVVLALCGMQSTNIISAPSISLEGKNLWIAQSFPIDGGDVLLSKAYAHMTVCIPPSLLASFAFLFILDMTPLRACLIIIVPVIFSVFQALLGVAVNLRFPKFDWISETVAVKQGLSTMITMFSSMGVVALPVILYITVLVNIMSAELFIILYTAALAAVSAVMYGYLKTKGNAIFPYLG